PRLRLRATVASEVGAAAPPAAIAAQLLARAPAAGERVARTARARSARRALALVAAGAGDPLAAVRTGVDAGAAQRAAGRRPGLARRASALLRAGAPRELRRAGLGAAVPAALDLSRCAPTGLAEVLPQDAVARAVLRTALRIFGVEVADAVAA